MAPPKSLFRLALALLLSWPVSACDGGGDSATRPSAGSGTVRGSVLDDLDQGVPDLTVRLSTPTTGEILDSTRTGPDGEYRFGEAPAGELDVRLGVPPEFALTSEMNPVTVTLEPGQTRAVDFRLRLRAGLITGTVTDTLGAPVEGAAAALRLEDSGDTLVVDTTGATGLYRFERVPVGDYLALIDPPAEGLVLGEHPRRLTVTDGSMLQADFVVVLRDLGTWESLAPLNKPRTENSAVALGDRIYVVGGFAPGLTAELDVERYDPTSDSWATVTQLPAGVNHTAIAAVGGLIYVVGGYGGNTTTGTDTLRIYDPVADAWTKGAPMPTPRGAHAAVVHDGKIHAIGGSQNNLDGLTAHEVYDPATDSWAARAPMPTPRHHIGAAAIGDRIYVTAGRDPQLGTRVTRLEIYDTNTDSWEGGPSLPTGRSGVAGIALDGKFYVFGGEAFVPDEIFDEAEVFDPASRAWTRLNPMPTARHGLGAAVIDGAIYVVGGGPEAGITFTGANERLTPP